MVHQVNGQAASKKLCPRLDRLVGVPAVELVTQYGVLVIGRHTEFFAGKPNPHRRIVVKQPQFVGYNPTLQRYPLDVPVFRQNLLEGHAGDCSPGHVFAPRVLPPFNKGDRKIVSCHHKGGGGPGRARSHHDGVVPVIAHKKSLR